MSYVFINEKLIKFFFVLKKKKCLKKYFVNMSDEESGGELLEQLKKFDVHVPEKESFKERFIKSWKNLKLKSAIGHVGLLISLCIYCGVGGLVSIFLF